MSTPLASWHPQAAQRLQQFVSAVTDPSHSAYVEPSDRIATFDNDGTLWCEKPLYIQLAFVVERVKALAAEHPQWPHEEPFSAVLSGDLKRLQQLRMPEDVLTLVAATHAGMTQAEFQADVVTFFDHARHPRWQRPYTALVYQPMVELVQFLQQHQFTVYLCSAGGLDFMRVISARAYGIPPEHVVGSSIQKKYRPDGTFERTAELVKPINDQAGKPVLIERHIGKRPILAGGNSDGDIAMLDYVTQRSGASLALLLHHDDAEREYAYDAGAEAALTLAKERPWQVVSMRSDFLTIFPE
ncbi:MAG: HAD family hydrolase [Leptolyngbyaceae cyanobacterium]